MDRLVPVQCPYCGEENRVLIVDDIHQKTVVTCEGKSRIMRGCGRSFVVDAVVSITTKTLKIEEEEENV